MRAVAGFADRVAARAKFLDQRAAVPGRILRLRGGAQNQKRQQRSDERQMIVGSRFIVSSHPHEDLGAPEGIRTPDPQIRSLVLYPAELPALA